MQLNSIGIFFKSAVYLFCLTCIYAAANAVRAAGLTIPPIMPHAQTTQPLAASPRMGGGGTNSAVVPTTPIALPQRSELVRPLAAGFTFTVVAVNHPCGIFQVNQPCSVNLLIRNNASKPLVLGGKLEWHQLPDSSSAPGLAAKSDSNLPAAGDEHSAGIIPTAIRPTLIQPANAMQIVLPVHFPAAGRYVLLWRHGQVVGRISPAYSVILRPHGGSLPVAESRWISLIPDGFYKSRSSGYISDYMRQTGVRRYLADISISRPSAGLPAIPKHPMQFMRIVRGIHHVGGQVVLRLNLFCRNGHRLPQTRWLAARLAPIFHQRSPDISAIVVNPIGLNVASRMALALRGVQLAAAQRVYHHIVRLAAKIVPAVPVVPELKSLGADSYCPLDPDLFNASIMKKTPPIFAVSDNRRWLAFMHTVSRLAHPPVIWVLPPFAAKSNRISSQTDRGTRSHRPMGGAMALAAGATLAPASAGRRFSAAAHWLGDAVRFAPVHSHLPPTITVFQANKRAVAIVTGLGAGTIHDNFWRAWQRGYVRWRRFGPSSGGGANSGWHHLLAGQFPRGHLTIYDPEAVLQSFNANGQKLPTPFPGEQQIPLNAKVYFVTAPGSAMNLVAALRTAEIHGLPPALMYPELFTIGNAIGAPSPVDTKAGPRPVGPERSIATGIYHRGIDGIQVRWIIRNAGVGRLYGRFRMSILAERGRKSLSNAEIVAKTTWKLLQIPSGQYRILTIKIPDNRSGTHLILRASLRGTSFQERVALPLTAIARPAEGAIGNGTAVRK